MTKKQGIIATIILCLVVGLLTLIGSSNNDTYTTSATKQRWIILRDTLEYVIENPKINKKHPSIAKTLNVKRDKHIENPFAVKFEPTKLSKPGDMFKDDKYKSTEVIQNETFKKLRKVEKMINKDKTDYKLCYLTFDDGPYAKTKKILKRLDRYNIQATFFTTSVNGKRCYDDSKVKTAPFYKKYVKYGHTIANHTYTHGIFNGLYNSKKSFMKAIRKQEKHVRKLTGYTTRIARFPGGSYTAGSLRSPIIKALKKEGYAWVDWSCETGDGGALKSESQGYKNFKRTMGGDIEVVLCHDYAIKTYHILPKMIKYARKNNYIFAPLFPESKALN